MEAITSKLTMTEFKFSKQYNDDVKKGKTTKYVSKKPDENGYIPYTEEEHAIWHDLIVRQKNIVKNRACQEFLDGIDILGFTDDEIPQPLELNKRLSAATGWKVANVAALIPFDKFFWLLANKQFPAASFIRTREELDYLQEPDIFHEYFGHCPLLTNPHFAAFTQRYGQLGLEANEKDRIMLARLYWFTVEFGLISKPEGLRIYGGGILSSKEETVYALENETPERKPLDVLDAFRTPYRIDILQPVYFVIDSFEELYKATNTDLIALINQARAIGMHPPKFTEDE